MEVAKVFKPKSGQCRIDFKLKQNLLKLVWQSSTRAITNYYPLYLTVYLLLVKLKEATYSNER